MKYLIFLILAFSSAICPAQDIWELVNYPDTLNLVEINAQKEGFLFISSSGGYNYYDGLFRSEDNGMTWQELMAPSGDISCIRYNADGELYLVVSGRIFRSPDDGDTFENIYDGPNSPYLSTVNFSPEGVIYAMGFADLIRSQDNGVTWDTAFHRTTNQFFSDIDFGPNGEIYVVGGAYYQPGSGFLRSLDNCLTWENIGITDDHLHFIEVDEVGNIMVGAEGTHFSKSEDGGTTFTDVDMWGAGCMESNSFDDLIVGLSILFQHGCRLSSDWGESWINLTGEIQDPSTMQVSITPDDKVYLLSYANSSYQIFRSIDPIVSTKNLIPKDEFSIFPIPAGDKLFINNHNQREGRFVIYNHLGQPVLSGPVNQNSIDISLLKSGLYIFELNEKSEKLRKKVIVIAH